MIACKYMRLYVMLLFNQFKKREYPNNNLQHPTTLRPLLIHSILTFNINICSVVSKFSKVMIKHPQITSDGHKLNNEHFREIPRSLFIPHEIQFYPSINSIPMKENFTCCSKKFQLSNDTRRQEIDGSIYFFYRFFEMIWFN